MRKEIRVAIIMDLLETPIGQQIRQEIHIISTF